jgi:hypothetical protein
MKRRNQEFQMDDVGVMYFRDRLCVPNDKELKKKILDKGPKCQYTIYPRETKMNQDLKKVYWWPRMKKDLTHYVSICVTCQKVKAEHKKSAGLLQPLPIPQWKLGMYHYRFCV